MDLGWFWAGFGVDLGWIWDGFGVDLGWFWGGFGVDLGWFCFEFARADFVLLQITGVVRGDVDLGYLSRVRCDFDRSWLMRFRSQPVKSNMF